MVYNGLLGNYFFNENCIMFYIFYYIKEEIEVIF